MRIVSPGLRRDPLAERADDRRAGELAPSPASPSRSARSRCTVAGIAVGGQLEMLGPDAID